MLGRAWVLGPRLSWLGGAEWQRRLRWLGAWALGRGAMCPKVAQSHPINARRNKCCVRLKTIRFMNS